MACRKRQVKCICYELLVAALLYRPCLSQRARDSEISELHTAKPMYSLPMNVLPINVQIVRDIGSTQLSFATFDLVYTTSESEVRRIADLTQKTESRQTMIETTRIVTSHLHVSSPNRVGVLQPNTIDKQPPYVWWIAAGGFAARVHESAVPTAGAVYLVDMSKTEWKPVPIYTTPTGVITNVFWMDMDLDQRKDCLTVKEERLGAQLIWLKQPAPSGTWEEHVISNSTVDLGGSEFRVIRMRTGKKHCVHGRCTPIVQKLIFIAGRRTNKLMVYWVDDPDNDWTQKHLIQMRVIADNQLFVSLEVADLNVDGTPELLATVAAIAGKPGRLIAYEVPKYGSYKTGKWREHIISEWTSTKTTYKWISPHHSSVFNARAPGIGKLQLKPHILVSGGSDGKVYVIAPDSWSHVIWRYTTHTIFVGSHTVGKPAVKDVDGDGNAEIFIPSGQAIHVMRYELTSGQSEVGMDRLRYFLYIFVFLCHYFFIHRFEHCT